MRKSIFEVLFFNKINFAVCVNTLGSENNFLADYFILVGKGVRLKFFKEFTGFSFNKIKGYNNIYSVDISKDDIEIFELEHKDRFNVVSNNDFGIVYELKGRSFKNAYSPAKVNTENSFKKKTILFSSYVPY